MNTTKDCTIKALGISGSLREGSYNRALLRAARGLRDMDGEEEEIEDPEELVQVRRQARRVHVESVLAAVLLTGIAVAVPW